jgi:GT2 family glycosyltransferase
MARSIAPPQVTICLLTFGDFPELARRALQSIREHCSRADYHLIVGANAVNAETLALLRAGEEAGEIDLLMVSAENLSKCPMMRRMFAEVKTEYIWWFDDDSYITSPTALVRWLRAAKRSTASTVMWGCVACCGHPACFADMEDAVAFVRSAAWYRGLPPPSWRVGGGGHFDFRGLGIGDGRWVFILGGCFMIRTAAVRALDWPDPRLFRTGDDVFLGEAIRQQGWDQCNLGSAGVALDTQPRRGPTRPS